MKGRITVDSQEAYDEWMARQLELQNKSKFIAVEAE